MDFANNLDQDVAPHNVGPHLRSKLFDMQIVHLQKTLDGDYAFLQIFKERKIF